VGTSQDALKCRSRNTHLARGSNLREIFQVRQAQGFQLFRKQHYLAQLI
jgi:hypothetical protein